SSSSARGPCRVRPILTPWDTKRRAYGGLAGGATIVQASGDDVHKLKLIAKDVFFPGLDLHTRCRYRMLDAFIRPGNIDTLDAGCGNGALAFRAFRKGNRVLAVTLLQREVADTTALFQARGIPADRVEFRQLNIYDLRSLN